MLTGKSWTAVRRRALERDRRQCQICGDIAPLTFDGALFVHHIIHRAQGGPDDASNAITLCDLCHGVIHGYAAWFGVGKLSLVGIERAQKDLQRAREWFEWFCRLPPDKRQGIQTQMWRQLGIRPAVNAATASHSDGTALKVMVPGAESEGG
ncbi:MAG: HNH endonuclease [Candidatus Binatia bacterium]